MSTSATPDDGLLPAQGPPLRGRPILGQRWRDITFVHWRVDPDTQKQYGAWQYCSEVSGAALKKFMDKYPFTDAPEPYAY